MTGSGIPCQVLLEQLGSEQAKSGAKALEQMFFSSCRVVVIFRKHKPGTKCFGLFKSSSLEAKPPEE